jgi:hypothetical protein
LCAILYFTAAGRDASAEDFFQWSARASASGEYNDNVFLRKDNKDHDWIVRFTPGLTLSLLTEETEATLDYDFSLTHYARNDELSGVRHYLTLSGFQGIRVTERATLDLDALLRISEDPFEIGQPGEDVSDVVEDRNRTYRTTLGGRINYFVGAEDFFYAGFTYSMLLNEESGVDDRREYLPTAGFEYWFTLRYGSRLDYSYGKGTFDTPRDDYDSHLGTASLLYRVNPRTEMDLSYEYNNLRYDRPTDGYDVHQFTLGVSHEFSPQTSGSLSGGYFIVVPEEGGDQGEPTGSISFIHAIPRGTFTLDGAAGYRRQFFQTENNGLSFFANVTTAFTYQLMEKLSVSLTGSYFRDEYQEEPKGESDNWRAGTAFEYLFLEWLQASLSYEYRQRESSVPNDDGYVDHRVFLNLTASYFGKPRPF